MSDELPTLARVNDPGIRALYFVAMLGGAAGTYASLGEQGPTVQKGMGERLGVTSMRVPSRSISDHFTENICVLAMLAVTCGKIGR